MEAIKLLENGIRIVEYHDGLAKAVAAMFNISNDDWGGSVSVSTPESVRAMMAKNTQLHTYIAMDGDAVVGWCGLAKFYKDPNTLYVEILDVIPEYQGKKVGKALVLLCVEQTIALGYKRLDLHTWSGNTKAVPLYKKCGFLWQDRGDTTLLNNYIPEITTHPAFAKFFAKADWYNDTTRDVGLVEPDEVEVNDFNLAAYSWEKDGDMLKIGYERTGKRIHMVETNSYKVEMMVECHELAFGVEYDCVISAENKTKNPLTIKIDGRTDGPIELKFHGGGELVGKQEFIGKFSIGELGHKQDKDKVHPCVAADITMDGDTVQFGLGIDIKAPLEAEMIHPDRILVQVGVTEERYINFESGLSEDATVEFEFEGKPYKFEIEAHGKASVQLNYTPKQIGYEAVPITYRINDITYTRDLHIVNQGFGEPFTFENEKFYGVASGPWRLTMYKMTNNIVFRHILRSQWLHGTRGTFAVPNLGKPFSDEFGTMTPEVRTYADGGDMVLEATFTSEKYRGIILTQIARMSAAGKASRTIRITNTNDKPTQLHLIDRIYHNDEINTAFAYDGHIQTISRSTSDLDNEKFQENWIFDAMVDRMNFGICWPAHYKFFAKWGEALEFEVDCGEIVAGGSFETDPIEMHFGTFPDFQSFRAYATQKPLTHIVDARQAIEIAVNGHNPFITGDKFDVAVKNHRNIVLEGDIHVHSTFGEEVQRNCAEQTLAENVFNISIGEHTPAPIEDVLIDLHLTTRGEQYKRAAFFVGDGAVSQTMDNGVFVINSGAIEFRLDPRYSPGVFSLVHNGQQWLRDLWPTHGPYSWDNPWLGGYRTNLDDMMPNMIIEEKITAEFVEITDNFGNKWSGVKSIQDIQEFDDAKGTIIEAFFLTLPGLPVLCHFIKYYNNTGEHKKQDIWMSCEFMASEDLADTYAEIINAQNQRLTLRAGAAQMDCHFIGHAEIIGDSARTAAAHFVRQQQAPWPDESAVYLDNKVSSIVASYTIVVPNGGHHTTRPDFIILTEVGLDRDMLVDLEKICFDR